MCRRVFPIPQLGTRGVSFNSKLLDHSCGILGALLRLGRRFPETWGTAPLPRPGQLLGLLLEPLRGSAEHHREVYRASITR